MCRRNRRPEWVTDILDTLDQALDRLNRLEQLAMTSADQQQEINDDVQRILAATDAIKTEIANLEAQHPTLDLTALKDAIGGLEGIEQPPTPPTPPTA